MDARDVIAAFGGHDALARKLSVPAVVTYTWHRRNRIAAHAVPKLAALASENGIKTVSLGVLAEVSARRTPSAPAEAVAG